MCRAFQMEELAVLAEVEAKGEELHVPLAMANHAQYSGKTLVTDSRVPGRLLGKQALYESIGAEPYVIETVASGYKLEFDLEPPPGGPLARGEDGQGGGLHGGE